MISKLHVSYIVVNNLEESKVFYQEVLGFKIKKEEEKYVEFENNFAIVEKSEGFYKVEPTDTHIMFQVNNIEECYKVLQEKKVDFRLEPLEKPFGKIAAFIDPNGHVIEIIQPI